MSDRESFRRQLEGMPPYTTVDLSGYKDKAPKTVEEDFTPISQEELLAGLALAQEGTDPRHYFSESDVELCKEFIDYKSSRNWEGAENLGTAYKLKVPEAPPLEQTPIKSRERGFLGRVFGTVLYEVSPGKDPEGVGWTTFWHGKGYRIGGIDTGIVDRSIAPIGPYRTNLLIPVYLCNDVKLRKPSVGYPQRVDYHKGFEISGVSNVGEGKVLKLDGEQRKAKYPPPTYHMNAIGETIEDSGFSSQANRPEDYYLVKKSLSQILLEKR